ncbi:MAG: hypothetical protein ACM3NV_10530 [Syntrophothermus sp.]
MAENEPATPEPTEPEPQPGPDGAPDASESATEVEEAPARVPSPHRKTVLTLLIVGTLVTFLAIFSIWVNRQALNTENWVNTSEKLLQNEEIRSRLATYMSNELFANVDVQQELEQALPPRLAPLAGPAAGGLQQLAPQLAEKILETSQFQALWATANKAAHEAFLKVINGGGNAVSTEGGEVTLQLGTLLTQVGAKLGVGGNLAEKIPPEAGELTILKSEQLSAAQEIAKLVRRLPVVLTLLAVILFALGIYLAGPRRRESVRGVGIAFVAAGLLALIVRGIAGGYVVSALSSSASVEPAAEAVWNIGTSMLVTVATSAIAFGIILIAGAWLAGPTKSATKLRRLAAPHLRDDPVPAYAVASLVFLALILWAPIAAFGKPLGILLFAILFAAGVALLRRQVLAEFPAELEEKTTGTTA